MTETTTRYEAETDRRIADAYREYLTLARAAANLTKRREDSLRIAEDYRERATAYAGKYAEGYVSYIATEEARAASLEPQIETAREAALAAYDSYHALERDLYTGWSRFFLVTSSDGHIHRSMGCSTCHITTTYAWLPDLSGLTEADAVADQGEILCSVCFPSAPVAWTNGLSKAEAAKAAGRCPGSGSYLNRDKPHRTGYYSGNWATCPDCQQRVTLTSTFKLRAHKPRK